jgi:hypothetical protein
VFVAALRKVQGMAEEFSNRNGQRHQVPLTASYPHKRLFLLSGHVEYTRNGIKRKEPMASEKKKKSGA